MDTPMIAARAETSTANTCTPPTISIGYGDGTWDSRTDHPAELHLSEYAFVRLTEKDVRGLFACLETRPVTADQTSRGAAVRLSLNWEDGARGAVARPVPTPPVTQTPGLRALVVVREADMDRDADVTVVFGSAPDQALTLAGGSTC